MSSRGSLIGNTPASGLYEAPVTPQDPEDLPVYVSDELLHLGGIVNGVLEGGAFPPTAKMPQRWREGMMIYFTTALEDRYKDTNDIIIRGAGVWLYRKGRWWKIIDDPSEVVRGVYVFQTGDESPPPSPGITLENPPTGWTEEPQVKDRDEWIWACPLLRYDSETGEYEWGIPVAWSTGVVDALTPVFRYIAAGSSQAPIISNPYGREPITTEGESFSENIPPLDHPNGKDAIYMTQAGVDTFSDIVINPWSDPTRFSTPDQTTYHKAWAVGTDWDDSYPSFNPNASGLPGSDWSHTQPASTREFPIWVTERLEWPDGTSQTIWTTPTYWNAQDGVNGAPGVPGIEGDLYEQWFLESVGNPGTPSSTYPPTGGWEDTTPVNPTNGVWMSFLRRNEETGAASYPWSYPILISGVAGEPGIPGTDGSVFTPWYKASASFPGVPPSGVYPPAGWTQDTSTLTGTIWVTTVLVNEAGDTQGAYTYPIQWNGLDGLDGLDGTDGADGQRGTVSVQATGGSWNNTTAYNAIVSATGGAPVDWDVVTISNSSFVETRRYAGGGNPGTWSVLDLVVDGDAVITGTLGADKITSNSITTLQLAANSVSANEIAANSITTVKLAANAVNADKIAANTITSAEISAGAITGNEINAGSSITIGGTAGGAGAQEVIRMQATDGSSNPNGIRFWIGNLTQSSANFSVDKFGNMFARNATFDGNITSSATITGGTINGSQINSANGNFTVNTAGDMTCQDATINGSLLTGGKARDTRIDLIGSTHMRVMSADGFGSNNQFIEWFGIKQMIGNEPNLAACTEANAITYLKENGDAYFGGTLSAGILKNSIQVTQNSSTAEGELNFTSNGGNITIVFSASFTGNSYHNPAEPAGGGATGFTAVLERKTSAGGSYSTVATLNGSGTWIMENEGVESFGRTQASGSLTYTDSLGTAGTRWYRIRMVTRSNPSPYTAIGAQNMTFVSTEE